MFQIELPKEKTRIWDNYCPILRSTDGRSTTIYLNEPISFPSEYNEACFLLDSAQDGDKFTLVINNPGGSADSAFMLVDAIKASKATVHAKLSGTVASAATIITMACDTIEVADFTSFMCHNYNHGTSGSGAQVKEYVNFTDREFTAAAADIYTGFLSASELKAISTQDKEIWLNKAEVLSRWEAKQAGTPITATPKPTRGRKPKEA